jgi:hypothetical protein
MFSPRRPVLQKPCPRTKEMIGVDQDLLPSRHATLRKLGAFRVLWWVLGGHGRVPSSSPEVEVEVIRGPSLPREALDGVELVIAEAHDLGREEVRGALLRVLESPGRPPVLLLTVLGSGNVPFLKDLPVEEVAWTFEPEEDVLAKGLRLVQGTVRTRIAEYVLRQASGCPAVRSAVSILFVDPDPPARVQDLARRVFVSPRELERRWRTASSGGSELTLKKLVDLALLLRARELCRQGLRLPGAAHLLGVHQRRLERVATRLFDSTCHGFFALDHKAVWRLVCGGLLGGAEQRSGSV